MQMSKTFDYNKNDHIERANVALLCCSHFGIKDVLPVLSTIAAPVSALAHYNKNGEKLENRLEIDEAIPWDERSMKTFGVVYSYESVASFLGIDGKTYVVPNDKPVLDYLQSCGYIIAPYGKNLDGSDNDIDSLIFKEKDDNSFLGYKVIDKNLSPEILEIIDTLESDRPYYLGVQHYAGLVRFGGTLGLLTASEEELQNLSLSERKIANISDYGRITDSGNIEEYVQYALQQYSLSNQNTVNKR